MPHLMNIVVLVILYKFSGVLSLPDVACPNLFKYVRDGDKYFGRITLTDLPLSTIKVDVRVVQEGSLPSKYIGTFSTEQDLDTVNIQLNKGEPIRYRLDFPLPNTPPKLLRIAVNDNEICSASSIPPPSVTINTQHTVFPVRIPSIKRVQTTHRPPPPPPPSPEPTTPKPQPTRKIPTFIRPQTPTSSVACNDRYDDNPFLKMARCPTTAAPTDPDFRIEPTQPQDLGAVCGRETATLTPFIHGGTMMERGEFPWLSAIYSKFSQNFRFICGGSLISARTVVSAAHCFMKLSRENVVVYLGRYNLDNYSEKGYAMRGIQNLIMHPQFNKEVPSFPDADIAILQLESAVEYTRYITPICLWSGNDGLSRIAGSYGTVAGWGSKDNDNAVSALPHKVDINIATERDCLTKSALYRAVGSRRTFCAGNGDDTGPCFGDSGGGLMIQRNGVWMLRGIVSAGQTVQRNCKLEEYVIYCDVAKHKRWVKDNMV